MRREERDQCADEQRRSVFRGDREGGGETDLVVGTLGLDGARAIDERADEELGIAVYGCDDRSGNGLGERLVRDL